MATTTGTYIGNILKRAGNFSDEQVNTILDTIRREGVKPVEAVIKLGYASEEQFMESLARVLNLEYIRLGSLKIERNVLERLPARVVFQYNVIPVAFEDGVLRVATSDPFDAGLVDILRLAGGCDVKLVLCPAGDIIKASKSFYGVGAETVDRMMQDDRYVVAPEETVTKVDVSEMDQEASVVKFVNQIIWEACQQGATDIHFEPMENQLRIRYRVDGVLHQTPVPPQLNRFQAAIISRIKVMANLDIAEKRLPMDGRIGLKVQGRDIDIRVSTLPTVYGESVSLRLLQSKGTLIQIEELGMSERDSKIVNHVINRPNGIVLVTGPTGSGKTTSLYAFLHKINTIDQRILTAEDPVEYEIPGVNQVQVRPNIGLTFARAMRAFLRQDPDIIMVGEIRDLETAEIAIQASLTGHLVFSTLHTNDSAGAFTRLLDMGVEPYLIASSVEAVIAQRLVRKLCRTCRRAIKPDIALLKEAGFSIGDDVPAILYEAKGCDECRATGYSGRTGIFEVLQVSDAIRSLIVKRRPSYEIKQQAISEGMRTLRDDGWLKIKSFITSVSEVLRVTEESV
jgi:type II secretion system protein E